MVVIVVDVANGKGFSVSEVSQREVRGSVARSMSSREAMTPIAPMLAAPLGIVPPSPMTSSVAGTSNLDLTGLLQYAFAVISDLTLSR